MERDDAIQTGDESVTHPIIQGNFGGGPSSSHSHVAPECRPTVTSPLEDLSVPDEVRRTLLRSRIFGSISVAGAQGVSLHRGILRIVSDHLAGRNPMAATDGAHVFVEFALNSRDPNNAAVVRRFADGVARLMGEDAAVLKAQVMQFDTSDIDPYLLPEHRSE